MRYIFHLFENVRVNIVLLTINARGDEMYSAIGFIRNMPMLSYPVEQSSCKLLMTIITSSEFVACTSNCSVVLFPKNYVILRQMSDVFTGSVPAARVAVLL